MADRHSSRQHRAPRSERGLFDSGPRFLLIVALLAAATTGPTAAVALAGRSALGDANGPATAPLIATGPALTTVQVPGPGDAPQGGSTDDGVPADLRPELQRVGTAVPTVAPFRSRTLRAQ